MMTCSICLQHTDLEQIASLKGCDHTYCGETCFTWITCASLVFHSAGGAASSYQCLHQDIIY